MALSDIARGLTVKVELPYIALPRLTTLCTTVHQSDERVQVQLFHRRHFAGQ